MITYRLIDASCPLPTCLHRGPLPLAAIGNPAYVETVSDISSSTVAQTLTAISARYGLAGVLALDGEQVVGKIRAYPQALIDHITYPCVQQERTIRPVIEIDWAALPAREDSPILHLYCIQVAAAYQGQGIAGGMLDYLITTARAQGWQTFRARAIHAIPQLLAWSGQFSRMALARRRFVVTGSNLSPELREGVVSQRAGAHGEAVRTQWDAYAHLSDDEAGQVFEMTLDCTDTRPNYTPTSAVATPMSQLE